MELLEDVTNYLEVNRSLRGTLEISAKVAESFSLDEGTTLGELDDLQLLQVLFMESQWAHAVNEQERRSGAAPKMNRQARRVRARQLKSK